MNQSKIKAFAKDSNITLFNRCSNNRAPSIAGNTGLRNSLQCFDQLERFRQKQNNLFLLGKGLPSNGVFTSDGV